MIERFEITPARACAGEAVLAEVGLREGAQARVSVGGRAGQRATVTFAEAGDHEILALAHGWEGGREERRAMVRVEDCAGQPRLTLSHQFSAAEDDVVVFHVDEVEGLVGRRRYHWTVDAGDTIVTDEPNLRHSLALRDQTGPTTSVVAAVEAIDGEGQAATGRHSVTVNNPLWLLARSGEIRLPALAERFPQRRAGAHLVTEVAIRNLLDDHAVEFTQVQIDGLPCDAPEDRRTLRIPAASAMPASSVAPGQTLRTRVRVPAEMDGLAICTLEIALLGNTDSGAAVRSDFLLEAGVHQARSHPASASVARMSLRALVEARTPRVSDDEMKALLGNPRGEFDLLSR